MFKQIFGKDIVEDYTCWYGVKNTHDIQTGEITPYVCLFDIDLSNPIYEIKYDQFNLSNGNYKSGTVTCYEDEQAHYIDDKEVYITELENGEFYIYYSQSYIQWIHNSEDYEYSKRLVKSNYNNKDKEIILIRNKITFREYNKYLFKLKQVYI